MDNRYKLICYYGILFYLQNRIGVQAEIQNGEDWLIICLFLQK